MIQAPDFKERQIFFIDAVKIPDCELSLRNENILIKEEGKTKDKIPVNKLVAIFIIGDMTITSKLLQKILRPMLAQELMLKEIIYYVKSNMNYLKNNL